MNIYIYALIDPRTNLVRYVGQTNNLRNRLYLHMSNPTTSTIDWITELKQEKLRPNKVILEATTPEDAAECEQKWFVFFNRAKAPLLNKRTPSYSGIYKRNEVKE